MEERTEDQKLFREPLKVVLGGKEHEVKILSIKYSREWRKKAISAMLELPGFIGTSSDDRDAFNAGITKVFTEIPDKVIDLFFEYAKDLNRDEIEEIATEEEVSVAFGQVVALAFPLVTSLTTMPDKITQ